MYFITLGVSIVSSVRLSEEQCDFALVTHTFYKQSLPSRPSRLSDPAVGFTIQLLTAIRLPPRLNTMQRCLSSSRSNCPCWVFYFHTSVLISPTSQRFFGKTGCLLGSKSEQSEKEGNSRKKGEAAWRQLGKAKQNVVKNSRMRCGYDKKSSANKNPLLGLLAALWLQFAPEATSVGL